MYDRIPRPGPSFGCVTLVLCLLPAACASEQATEKRLAALQEEVDRVQSRADRLEERLTALEVSRQKQTLHVDSDGEVSVDERPELKVVKVAPDTPATQAKRPAEPEEAASKEGPRPVIRASGSAEGRIENLEGVSSPKEPAEPGEGGS